MSAPQALRKFVPGLRAGTGEELGLFPRDPWRLLLLSPPHSFSPALLPFLLPPPSPSGVAGTLLGPRQQVDR